MKESFKVARFAGLLQAFICVALYFMFAEQIMHTFIKDPTTVAIGTQILRARCFATPLMFLSFHMIYLTQAAQQGKLSLLLAFVRQIILNIPAMILLDHFWGLDGMVWSQTIADTFNVIFSYIVYFMLWRWLDTTKKIKSNNL